MRDTRTELRRVIMGIWDICADIQPSTIKGSVEHDVRDQAGRLHQIVEQAFRELYGFRGRAR